MKLPASFRKDQPKPIHKSNDKDEIILSGKSLFRGKIYRNQDLPDDVMLNKTTNVRGYSQQSEF